MVTRGKKLVPIMLEKSKFAVDFGELSKFLLGKTQVSGSRNKLKGGELSVRERETPINAQ